MNKRGELSRNLGIDTVMYLIIVAVFFSVMFFYLVAFQDGGALWEDFYAKEITRIINTAEPGKTVSLDVSTATEIARDNGKAISSVFVVDNVQNSISVSLRSGRATRFEYFNDVDITNLRVEFNQLLFDVEEVHKDDS